MLRRLLTLLALLGPGLSPGWSQQGEPVGPPAEEKGTFLGVLFAPVPELLYDQMPQLPRGRGVVVAHVLPDSPAAQAELRRNDVLLQYDDEKIRDCQHFARLIHDDKPGRKVRLTLLRGGKETTAEPTLALGPVLRIARAGKVAGPPDGTPRGLAKPAPAEQAAVSIAATPQGGNSMKVRIEYYQDGTGRLHTVTCAGTPEEIDAQLLQKKLPARVLDAARVGLQRLRDLALQKQAGAPSPAPRPVH
jgi:hypothetical protein